jgi:hypothetical protein
MAWRLLSILAVQLLLADAPVAMSVHGWASGCGSAIGVMAEHVGKNDRPAPAMRREAKSMCPTGYAILGESIQHSKWDGVVIQWAIQCRKPIEEANTPPPPPVPC